MVYCNGYWSLWRKGNLKVIGSVSSGFNDADRAALKSYEGKVLELGVMEKDNTEQTLRHPIVMRVRDDKSPADCKLKEIFSWHNKKNLI